MDTRMSPGSCAGRGLRTLLPDLGREPVSPRQRRHRGGAGRHRAPCRRGRGGLRGRKAALPCSPPPRGAAGQPRRVLPPPPGPGRVRVRAPGGAAPARPSSRVCGGVAVICGTLRFLNSTCNSGSIISWLFCLYTCS